MKLLIVILLSLVFSGSLKAESRYHAFERWLVVMDPSEYGTEEIGRFFLGGLSVDQDQFIVAGKEASVSARSLRTGQPLWTTPLKGDSQASWHVDEETIYGADAKGQVYALDSKTGERLWERSVRGMFFVEPVVDERHVYVMNSRGQLTSLERETGEWVWQQSDPDQSLFSLVSRHGLGFFKGRLLAGFPSGVLQAFEAHTGSRIWTDVFSSPGVDTLGINDLRALTTEGDYLAASSYGGGFRLWRAEAGSRRLLWEKQMSLHAAPTIDLERGEIFVSDREGRIQSFELETGYQNWEYQLSRGLATRVSTSPTKLWAGSSSGEVIVLDRKGKLLMRSKSFGSPIFQEPLLISDDDALVVTTKGILRRLMMRRI